MSSADDRAYETENQGSLGDNSEIPLGNKGDNDYASRTGQSHIPVTKDDADIPSGVNPGQEDSDEQLAKDDADAIDESNIVGGRTRGAKPSGGYREPGDEEGMPNDTGVSNVR